MPRRTQWGFCNHMLHRNGYRPDGKTGWAEARGKKNPKSPMPKKKKNALQTLILDGKIKLISVCSSRLVLLPFWGHLLLTLKVGGGGLGKYDLWTVPGHGPLERLWWASIFWGLLFWQRKKETKLFKHFIEAGQHLDPMHLIPHGTLHLQEAKSVGEDWVLGKLAELYGLPLLADTLQSPYTQAEALTDIIPSHSLNDNKTESKTLLVPLCLNLNCWCDDPSTHIWQNACPLLLLPSKDQ